MKWMTLIARLVLGIIFLYAGLVKSADSHQFTIAIAPFTILPNSWLMAVAIALSLTEILVGLLILLPKVYPIGAIGILFLSLFYISIIWWALAHGIIVNCDCFGSEETPSAEKMEEAIFRDVAFVGMALFILGAKFRKLHIVIFLKTGTTKIVQSIQSIF